tara:strand:+ start:376 stop:1599 length:1224 start_codon:yes stop_codon:yes gene_type:complete
MLFSDLNLPESVLKSLSEMGYEQTTPIQEKTLPPILAGKDVLGLAETGSGKTSACAIPLVSKIDYDNRNIQALILVPTRELALQYVQEVDEVAKHSQAVPFAVFGGFDMDIQKAKLKHGVHVLVATPGRLIDLIWNHRLDLTHVKTIVLDEADEMLKMGFIEDVDFIMSCMIQEHQTLLFSATMPKEVERLSQQYLVKPIRVELNRDQRAPQSLKHYFLHANRDKLKSLTGYIEDNDVKQAIVFCNSRDKANDLFKQIQSQISSVEIIHGGLDQDRRTSIFRKFRQKKIRIMIATDVAGRGLDFSHVTHVINYDFPINDESYTHRTGRAGRMGREGTAVTFVNKYNFLDLKRILSNNTFEAHWHGTKPDLDSGLKRKRQNSKQHKNQGRRYKPQNKNSTKKTPNKPT